MEKNRNREWVGEAVVPNYLDGAIRDRMHVGGLDYYDEKLYVALEQGDGLPLGGGDSPAPNGIWRINAQDMSYEMYHRIPLSISRGVSWCAVSPLNGRLYTKEGRKLY